MVLLALVAQFFFRFEIRAMELVSPLKPFGCGVGLGRERQLSFGYGFLGILRQTFLVFLSNGLILADEFEDPV